MPGGGPAVDDRGVTLGVRGLIVPSRWSRPFLAATSRRIFAKRSQVLRSGFFHHLPDRPQGGPGRLPHARPPRLDVVDAAHPSQHAKRPAIDISVIVPVHNNPGDLRLCLGALRAAITPDSEIIVVDDGSTDNTAAVAASMGVPVVTLTETSGPAAARNQGAGRARGAILFFVDADVVIARGAIERVQRFFADHPEHAAVFGSYDARPGCGSMVSRYRNLLHHFVHQRGNPDASTFWAGCGAIRRSVFHEVGGFDARRFPRPSIEDIELGYRLRAAGHRIRLDPGLQGTHLKRWTLGSLIRTDIARRALPWSRLILESGHAPNDLNLTTEQRVSAVLAGVAAASAPLGLLRLELLALPAAAFLAAAVLNRSLYAFFWRHGGNRFVALCIALHFLYYLYSGLTYLYARLEHVTRGAALAVQRLARYGAR